MTDPKREGLAHNVLNLLRHSQEAELFIFFRPEILSNCFLSLSNSLWVSTQQNEPDLDDEN